MALVFNGTKKIQVKHANGDILHRLIYESQECKDEDESVILQNELFNTFARNPQLTYCDRFPSKAMTMKFIGNRWVVEFQFLEVKGDTV